MVQGPRVIKCEGPELCQCTQPNRTPSEPISAGSFLHHTRMHAQQKHQNNTGPQNIRPHAQSQAIYSTVFMLSSMSNIFLFYLFCMGHPFLRISQLQPCFGGRSSLRRQSSSCSRAISARQLPWRYARLALTCKVFDRSLPWEPVNGPRPRRG